MNKPILYQNSNALQRSDAQQVLKEFSSVWKWRSDGGDTVLDVGCGSGDITMDLVVPILPESFASLVGCDLSADMVNYARNKHSRAKVSFEQFDLSIDLELQPAMKGMDFDHITSFNCLMWIQNQQIAARNLYKLLKPGGDMLIVFAAHHPIYDYYKKQSHDDRWSEYMTDVDEFISPYQYSNDPAADFRKHLTDAGFTECRVEAREKSYTFRGVQTGKNLLRSVNPFIDRLPIQDQEKFIEDLVQNFVENHLVRDDSCEDIESCRIAPTYKLIVAYARK